MLLKVKTKEELMQLKNELTGLYEDFKAKDLKLNMARGIPSTQQLDLSDKMLDCVNSDSSKLAAGGVDCRSYGVLDGIKEAKELFSQLLNVNTDEIIVGGNSSLNIMYDVIIKAMMFGMPESEKPWCKYDEIKFLCPVPGYDRHFAICESLGIKMINIPLGSNGPDMDMIEKLVAEDDTIKGIWCVPKYSNPDGITYSDDTVKRFAKLKPKAKDFRIMWDNAYCVHDLTDTPDNLLNLLDECKKADNENIVLMFASTSKISYAGAGVAVMAASKTNIDYFNKKNQIQTIGTDKMNQLRHVCFFKDVNGINAQMVKHRAIVYPKFEIVLNGLEKEIAPLGIANWHKPNGGYFISFNAMNGCAKRIVELCKQAGVILTPAGATFPYGIDPEDKNIRIAPTYPPVEELKVAIELFCLCVKIASVEKLLEEK